MEIKDICSIRNQRYPKPQTHWGWPIAIYLYLAGMGAGSFIIGMILNWVLNPSRLIQLPVFHVSFDLAKAATLWGAMVVALSSPFLILDLGIKKRFMYACLNPKTSWVARGFLILSTFILFGLATLALSVMPHFGIRQGTGLLRTLEIISFVFAFGTAIYTGILLKATKSIPLWNTSLLPLLFLVSALSTGSMAIFLSVLGTGLFRQDPGALNALKGGEQALVVIEGVFLYLYLLQRYRATDRGKDSVHLLLFGEKRLVFWGGIVLMGMIFPLVLGIIESLFHANVIGTLVAGFSLLCGGFFLRLGVLSAGIKDQIPMERLMEIQYDMRAVKTRDH